MADSFAGAGIFYDFSCDATGDALISKDADTYVIVVIVRDLIRATQLLLRNIDREPDRQLLQEALSNFSNELPAVSHLRNVLEHFDDYLLGRGRMQRGDPAADFSVLFHDPHDAHQWDMKVGQRKFVVADVGPALDRLSAAVEWAAAGPAPDPHLLQDLGLIRLNERPPGPIRRRP